MDNTVNLQRFLLNNSPERYLPDAGLKDAIEISIALDKPLLVTGEPGTGKTKLAHWLAGQLALQTKGLAEGFRTKPFIFNTKSTSVAADLFYNYDAVSHFGNIQRSSANLHLRKKTDNLTRQFIELRAMGLAIAQTYGTSYNELAGIRNYLGSKLDGPLEEAPMSSVVLIDEIDKAPREFANDLLNEMEGYEFEIKELNRKIKRSDNGCRIVTIMTSNDEKTLPNAFLRRCIFYHIDFPPPEKLLEITKLKLGIDPDKPDYDAALLAAIADFEKYRTNVVNKRPSTAELLDWVNLLYHNQALEMTDGKLSPAAKDPKYLGVITKTHVDIESAKQQ